MYYPITGGGPMSWIEWDEALSVNNDAIDAQHKKWIEIHNRLHEALISGNFNKVDTVCGETLQAMVGYTRYHFQFEEDYMKTIGFPGIVEHRRLHKDFDSKIYTLQREFMEGQVILNSGVLKLIKAWLLEHITHEDKKFSLYLQDSSTNK
jgi:hemerythrin